MTVSSDLDPRTVRSRDALVTAIGDLLAERPAAEISATDVVRAAGVSRPTLYQNFGDLPSLIVTAVTSRIQRLFDATLPSEPRFGPDGELIDAGAGLQELLQRLLGQATLLCHALHGPGGFSVVTELSSLLARRLRNQVPCVLARNPEDAPAELPEFVAHGIVGLVADWLDTAAGEREPAESVATRVTSLLTYVRGGLTRRPATQQFGTQEG